MKKTTITILSTLLIISAIFISDYTINKNFKIVKTGIVLKGDIVKYVKAKGVVEEGGKREVYSELPFSVKEIYIEEGDKVSQGQKLLDYNKNYLKNKFEFEKNSDNSFQSENIISKIDNYPSFATSPINGIITKINVKSDQIIDTNKPLIVISDLDNLIIKASIPENIISSIYPGQRVVIKSESIKDVINGYVYKIHPIAEKKREDNKNYITVDVKSDNYKNIKPGTNVDVEFEKENKKSAILIPFDSIMFDEDIPYVYINKYGYAVKKYVTLGEEYETEVEILKGINNEDKLVLNPKIQKIREGDKLSELDWFKSQKGYLCLYSIV